MESLASLELRESVSDVLEPRIGALGIVCVEADIHGGCATCGDDVCSPWESGNGNADERMFVSMHPC